MGVYNYVRLGASVAEPIDDAPQPVVAAIEEWLAAAGRSGSWDGVAWDVLPEPRLSLLALQHAISSDDLRPLELIHVVAVPERRLGETSREAVTGFFESLYGPPLSASLAKLHARLAGMPAPTAAARAVEHFANEAHLEALAWSDFDAPARGSATAVRRVRRGLARLAAGLALLALGVALGAALAQLSLFEGRLSGLLGGADAPAPAAEERLARLEGSVETLQQQLRASQSALGRLTRSQADGLAQLREDLEALRVVPPAAEPEAERAAVASEPSAAPAVQAEPQSASPARSFRVVARSARVRAGPSDSERTRGLLARGQRGVVTRARGPWLEIEPPPGLEAPAWIHQSVVELLDAPPAAPAEASGAPPAAPG